MEHCYMCESIACSREHVPPRNLFPESKDHGGENYRINLITVPSCDLHNLAKSSDDEFLMVSLAGIIGNNSIGYRHKLGKVERAVRRSSNRLLDKVILKKKEVIVVKVADNKYFDVIWGTPDVERLNKCFDHIVRGVHFHHFNASFKGTIRVLLGYLKHQERSQENFNEFITKKTEMELEGKPCYGENKERFFYQVTEKDQFGLYLFRLCFYGGLNIYAALIPENSQMPTHLGFELMKKGIKTFITLDDKVCEIN